MIDIGSLDDSEVILEDITLNCSSRCDVSVFLVEIG